MTDARLTATRVRQCLVDVTSCDIAPLKREKVVLLYGTAGCMQFSLLKK